MKYREVLIEDDKVEADSGTDTIDINVTDWITELIIHFSLKNGASTLRNQPPHKIISKIELVDGGQSYWNLSGPLGMAAGALDKGVYPSTWHDESANVTQRCSIPLMFGRYLGDPAFGFDAKKLTNPQLKVTWAKNAGHLADSLTLGVLAKVVEGVPAPVKGLFWKEVETFTSAASGVKTVDMPIDYPYRRVAVRPYLIAELDANCITHYKLDCDVGKFIAFDHDEREFAQIMQQSFPRYQFSQISVGGVGTSHEAWMSGDTATFPSPGPFGVVVKAPASGSSYYQIRGVDVVTHADVDPCWVEMLITGRRPESTYCYQFGLPDLPETWFPVTDYKDVDLKLTQAMAGYAVSVMVQQPRTLP